MRNTKKAFTLVELIVVITILAVLGTIAFISLQGYSGEARDSKRLSNVNDLVKKVNIEVSKGTPFSDLISATGTAITKTINGNSETSTGWTVNFVAIKENQPDFQDALGSSAKFDYPVAYSQGGSGTGAFKFMQVATISEAKNQAKVVGNYFQFATTDATGLISGTGTSWVQTGDDANTVPGYANF